MTCKEWCLLCSGPLLFSHIYKCDQPAAKSQELTPWLLDRGNWARGKPQYNVPSVFSVSSSRAICALLWAAKTITWPIRGNSLLVQQFCSFAVIFLKGRREVKAKGLRCLEWKPASFCGYLLWFIPMWKQHRKHTTMWNNVCCCWKEM